MANFFKLLACATLLAFGVLLVINVFDSNKSDLHLSYENLKQEHSTNKNYTVMKDFVSDTATKFELKKIRSDINSSKALRCFEKSDCSDSDFKKALELIPNFLEDHSSILSNFQQKLRSGQAAVGIKSNSNLQDRSFLSLSSLIRLKIIEINYLFSKTNDDRKNALKAVEIAQTLNQFLERSIYLPNSAVAITIILKSIQILRTSLQKNSPNRLSLSKVDAKKVIQALNLGEFIVTSNSLKELKKNKTMGDTVDVLGKKLPPLFLSYNRSINLYTDLQEKYSRLDCVYQKEIETCPNINISYMHPVNPVGRMLVPLLLVSPFQYKKITATSKQINALNL